MKKALFVLTLAVFFFTAPSIRAEAPTMFQLTTRSALLACAEVFFAQAVPWYSSEEARFGCDSATGTFQTMPFVVSEQGGTLLIHLPSKHHWAIVDLPGLVLGSGLLEVVVTTDPLSVSIVKKGRGTFSERKP